MEDYLNDHESHTTQQKRRKSGALGQLRTLLLKNWTSLLINLEAGNVQCNKKGLFGHIPKDNNF